MFVTTLLLFKNYKTDNLLPDFVMERKFIMAKTIDDFYKDLGIRESSGRYDVVNSIGYLGLYQIGEKAMVDAGYYKPQKEYKNRWDGEFTGKDGVFSKEDFLNNPLAQENAQRIYKQKQWKYLKKLGADKYVDQIVGGVKITESGLLAGAHLWGQDGVMDYLESDGKKNRADINGATVKDYIKKFANYDVSEIIKYKPPKQEPKDPVEQALINQIMTKFEGIYSRSEITKLVHDTISKTSAESLMSKSKEITKQENPTSPRKKDYSNGSSSDGKRVTINGNHILLEK